jgi:hypothetical protein
MSPPAPDVPEQIRQIASKEKPLAPKEGPPRSDGDPLDQSGQAIVALLQRATAPWGMRGSFRFSCTPPRGASVNCRRRSSNARIAPSEPTNG